MLCVIKPKGCKRCGGDLSLECDIYGVYAECIQCGANWSEEEIRTSTPRQALQPQQATPPPALSPARRRH